MPSKVCPANKSSLFGVTGSSELGGGQDRHLPVGGPWNGYTFTGAVRFGFDWSDVRRITSATLRLRTSGQVHIGFSSTPDFYVSRATADWTANSASSSGEGGSGWSTSPTVYPGPPATSTGRVSKRSSSAEGTDVFVDITSIVRAWAPATVEGGGAAPNYGVVLSRVASGDVTEFASNTEPGASLRPYITLAYDTDSPPPAPTITAPPASSTTIDPTPTLAATAVDPDGDPLELADIEVKKAGAVVWSALGSAAAIVGPSSISLEAGALPPGALTVRMRARANGVWGAWSADSPFTLDRPPVVGAWSSPPASVSGNRRPALAFATSDADADPLELYDVEVYVDLGGGAPGPSASYRQTNQSTGITGAAGAQLVSHTPTADLPIGPCLARSRVRSRGVWSAWSAYRAFVIVVAVPAVTIVAPPTDGGFVLPSWVAPPTAITARGLAFQADVRPPAGQTLTKVHHKLTRLSDAGAPVVIEDVDVALVPAGAVYSRSFTPVALGFTSLYGTFQSEWTATASNAGVTGPVVRKGRFSIGEWLGAVALGDSVGALAIPTELPLSDSVAVYYRAQSSPSAANGAAPWRARAEVATIQAELPATNAYLGVDVRIARRVDDADALVNGDFEAGSLAPWIVTGTNVGIGTDANAPAGPTILVVNGDGGTQNPGVLQRFPVIPGATYRASVWGRAVAGTARLQCVTRNAAGSIVNSSALIVATALAAWTFLDGVVLIPADGSVATLDIILRIPSLVLTDSVRFDGATCVGPLVGDGGMDKLALSWTSLG